MILIVLVAVARFTAAAADLALIVSGQLAEAALATPAIVCLIVTAAPGGRRGKGTG